jgi:CDP-diacylglycerol--glycerol-3-phosphate 3-phosphatidyltransferase
LVAWTGRADWVAAALVFLQITDWVDGPLARRTGTSSEFGARLDSWADLVMFSSLLGALVVLEGRLLWSEWPWVAAAATSFAGSVGYSLARFGVMPAYHQWSAKVSGPLTMLAALALLLTGAAWPVRVAAAAVTLANLEAILITRRLPAPAADIASALAVSHGSGVDSESELPG